MNTTEEVQARKTPEGFCELTVEMAVLAGQVQFLSERVDHLPYYEQPTEVLDRIENFADIDDAVAAFHGVIHAFLVAKMPHLAPVISVESHDLKRYVVLRNRPDEVMLLLPRVLNRVDDEWAGRKAEVD
jgi:hypothetical protein